MLLPETRDLDTGHSLLSSRAEATERPGDPSPPTELLARLSKTSSALFRSSAKLLTKTPSRVFAAILISGDSLANSNFEVDSSVPTAVLTVTGESKGVAARLLSIVLALDRGVEKAAANLVLGFIGAAGRCVLLAPASKETRSGEEKEMKLYVLSRPFFIGRLLSRHSCPALSTIETSADAGSQGVLGGALGETLRLAGEGVDARAKSYSYFDVADMMSSSSCIPFSVVRLSQEFLRGPSSASSDPSVNRGEKGSGENAVVERESMLGRWSAEWFPWM